MKSRTFIMIVVGFSIVCVCWILHSKNTLPESFWDLIGVTEQKQYEVYICYRDTKVVLDEKYKDNLINSLENMSVKGEKVETHGFTPSDYQLYFEQDGVNYTAQFYWFSGRRAIFSLGNEYEYCDRRVDIGVNGKIYTFYQSDEFVWNEEINKWAFDASVRKIGVGGRYELDGYDFESEIPPDTVTANGRGINGINYSKKSLQEILYEADQVVVAQCVGVSEEDSGEVCDIFTIVDVLKGKVDIGEKRKISRWMYGPHVQGQTGKSYITYLPVYLPEYEEGNLYLLCLDENVIEIGTSTIITHSITGGMFGSGIVDNNIVFPRYNTEYHPFYNVPIEDIERLCDIDACAK